MSDAVEVVMVAGVVAVVKSVDLSVEIVVAVLDWIESIDVAVDVVVAAGTDIVGAVAADGALPVDVLTNVGGIVQSFQIYCQEVLINPSRPSAT